MLITNKLNNELLIDVSDFNEVTYWCQFLNCSENTLFICMYFSGNSIVLIQSFLSENKEWLENSNIQFNPSL